MSQPDHGQVLTVGHSTLSYERFLQLLQNAGVSAVADVRSTPFSRHSPHFNARPLHQELRADGIAYVFLGEELGGRPKSSNFFCDGIADYEKMATSPAFKAGIERVATGAERFRIALMCSEHDPLDCHRCLLVGRALAGRRMSVSHIHSNGKQTSHAEIEEKLLSMSGRGADDFFAPAEERLAAAYRDRARKVAFALPSAARLTPIAAE